MISAARLAASAWVAAEPGLADTIAALHATSGPARDTLAARAVALARFGPIDPWRVARHATAASLSRALRLATNLPAAISTRRPLTDPAGFLRDATVEAFVDQLALGGPPSAELARLIAGAGELYPPLLRRELARREIAAVDLLPEVVQAVIDEAFTGGPVNGRLPTPVRLARSRPVTGTPVAALYRATVGALEPALVRVRRPRIAEDLLSDSRLAAGAAVLLGRLAPATAGIAPTGFVHLVLRQHLEAVDLRFEALGLVELALVLEDLGHDGIVVAHPRAGLVGEHALVLERTPGTPATRTGHGPPLDLDAVIPALVGITLEAAIAHGVFWADPAPEHLLVRPDGRLALVGAGTVGRFTPAQRLAGARTLKAVLTGDYGGMVEGMRIAGALGPDVDVDGLIADLAASERLDPMAVLRGGEGALLGALRTLVGILLAHRLEPPVEVTLLLRTIFATGRLVSTLQAGSGPGLTAALMGLVPRLPGLLATAEAAAEPIPDEGQ